MTYLIESGYITDLFWLKCLLYISSIVAVYCYATLLVFCLLMVMLTGFPIKQSDIYSTEELSHSDLLSCIVVAALASVHKRLEKGASVEKV